MDATFTDYSYQRVAYERYLAKADMIVNTDIDELIFAESGPPLAERVAAAKAGIVLCGGRWVSSIEPLQERLPEELKYPASDYFWGLLDTGLNHTKWAARGGSIEPEDLMGNHGIMKKNASFPIGDPDGIIMRHFHYLSTDWKEPRTNNPRPFAPAEGHHADLWLANKMSSLCEDPGRHAYPLDKVETCLKSADLPCPASEGFSQEKREATARHFRRQVRRRAGIFRKMYSREQDLWGISLQARCPEKAVVVAFNPAIDDLRLLGDYAPQNAELHIFVNGSAQTRELSVDNHLIHLQTSGRLRLHALNWPISAERIKKLAPRAYARLLCWRLSKMFGSLAPDIFIAGGPPDERLIFAAWAVMQKTFSHIFIQDFFSMKRRGAFKKIVKMTEYCGTTGVFEVTPEDITGKKRRALKRLAERFR